ncbi:MAG TPA: cyclic nucleotide-binding domain-containing protein [Candidatus Dormibacteraeota bacterium]
MDVRDDLVDILAGFSLFADLSTPELESVVESFGEETFQDGARVLRQGLTGSNFYVILDGSAAIRVDEVDRSILRPGDFFGEISCLLGVPPVADIVAHTGLRCLVLPGNELERFLIAHPRVMFRLLQGEARKLRTTTRWLS